MLLLCVPLRDFIIILKTKTEETNANSWQQGIKDCPIRIKLSLISS